LEFAFFVKSFLIGGMTIWILAILLMVCVALAGWRQGAIRAAFAFGGIIFGVWLANLLGKIFHPILPHVGASNPILAWVLAPLLGFILVQIIFKSAGYYVHRKAEVFYKHKAGDLRLSLWLRLNRRLGICVGVLNGAAYFILICFVIYNFTYWTQQTAVAAGQPALVRYANSLGTDLQDTHLNRTAAAVGHPPEIYYQLADLTGFLMQNPGTIGRMADYPAFTSFYERDDVQPILTDGDLTNAWQTGAPLGQIINAPPVQAAFRNKDLMKTAIGIVQTNLPDLTNYLQTGKSSKFDGEKIVGQWDLNVDVTLAWMRQNNPRMPATEMREVRVWMTQNYADTKVLVGSDNTVFLKNLPHLKTQAGQPATTEKNNWNGDWSRDGTNYDVHISFSGQDKYMTAQAEDLRLSLKDGKNLLIFDRD
jgi:uncharacterized membrane protein required for colicin V production